ncbi:GspH/FimT family pseudopilin [Endozoicomonas sp. G2_1]|uniref:GspH/FimT family pseudopilin n=1 Tax=Endozoicomonas sp. G2_1 TaxID=2821091 RepID=UPI002468C805|nr:GspH/FimT family pseudopilin [Endozoicomonas sp. G2_1]
MNKLKGFTLIELMVTIAILAIVSAIALPNLNEFLVRLRVDSQISELNRLLLTARNTAITSEQNVVVCPLASRSVTRTSACTTNWNNRITVFVDADNDGVFTPRVADPNNPGGTITSERLVTIKTRLETQDTIQFAGNRITYTPTGRVINNSGDINYCPNGYNDLSRAIEISLSGRFYRSSDTDNDGKDELRNGSEITCT